MEQTTHERFTNELRAKVRGCWISIFVIFKFRFLRARHLLSHQFLGLTNEGG